MNEIRLSVPVKKLVNRQKELFDVRTRYLAASIGRQFGKSTICLLRMFERVRQRKGIYWWVSPTYHQVRVIYDRFVHGYSQIISIRNKSYLECTLVNGAKICFRSADKPDNLRGETLKGVVMDECATIKPNVWHEIIQPMLSVNNGWADLVGTPKGPNWFRNICLSASKDWTVFHARSNESEYFPQSEYEEAQRTLPERIFRQEYQAEFLDDDSEVFRGVNDCISGTLENPQTGRRYIIGVDLAKSVDWTVLTIWDTHRARNHMVGYERFNQIDWVMQESRITSAAKKWNNALLVIDSTGVGDPVYDRLERTGLNVQAVKFTSAVKDALILSLSQAIEKREITYPNIPELVNELKIFTFERLPSGRLRYGAPSGCHDDIVISMALAVSHVTTIPQNLKIEGIGETVFADASA